MKEEDIAACVWWFLCPVHIDMLCHHHIITILFSVPCCMWILFWACSDITMFSIDCRSILLIAHKGYHVPFMAGCIDEAVSWFGALIDWLVYDKTWSTPCCSPVWFSPFVQTHLPISGGEITASRYNLHTCASFRHLVIARHNLFGSGSNIYACADLAHTGADCAFICIPHFKLANFYRRFFLIANFIFVLCMFGLYFNLRSMVT